MWAVHASFRGLQHRRKVSEHSGQRRPSDQREGGHRDCDSVTTATITTKTPSTRCRRSRSWAPSSSGASNAGTVDTSTNAYELQDYTSVTLSKNFLKFGARFRDNQESATSTVNFNGTFTFPSIQAYQITEQGLQAGLTPAQIQANGGGASQFTLIAGNPLARVNYFDLEPYVEDDWKARPNLTISGGLRFETQDHIHDHADFAPRLGHRVGTGKRQERQDRAAGRFRCFLRPLRRKLHP